MQCYELNLDHNPRIGGGHRVVFVDTIGYKWVRVCSTSLSTAKLDRREFDRAVVRELEINDKSRAHLQESMRRYAAHKGTNALARKVLQFINKGARA